MIDVAFMLGGGVKFWGMGLRLIVAVVPVVTDGKITARFMGMRRALRRTGQRAGEPLRTARQCHRMAVAVPVSSRIRGRRETMR